MATPVLIPVSEYLQTTYRPDCDFVDGKVKERSVGEKPHGLLQGILYYLFQTNRRAWGLLPLLEQRVQITPTRFRIPDLCVVLPDDPDFIILRAPELCVEVLSKGDSLLSAQEVVDDYRALGVKNIWVFDPIGHGAYRSSGDGLVRVANALEIEGTPVRVDLAATFAELSDLLAGRL